VLRVVSGIAHRLVGPQLALLARVPSFRLLALANFGSGVGTWLAFVALTVDIWDRTESGMWVAALLIADFLPVIVIGVLAGPLVDRLSRRRLMVAADLLRCAVFIALPFANSPKLIIALAGVAGFATGFFRPAVYAGLPNLVTDSELPSANALVQSIEAMTTIVGPLIGGVLVAVSDPDVAYWINAVTFLFSAALLVRIPGDLLQAARSTTAGHWRDLREGFSMIGGSRALLTVLLAWNVGMLGNAFVNVAEVKLAKVSFDAGDFGFGLLVGSAGLGVVLGSLSAGSWVERRGAAGVYGFGLSLMAIGIAAAALAPSVWVAAPAVAVSGAGNGIALVCNLLFVQRGAPDRLRGRVFTVLMSSNYAVFLVGMLFAGPLTDEYGARWVWGGAATFAAMAALVGFALARGIDEEIPDRAPLAATER
jgi:MFS family permease